MPATRSRCRRKASTPPQERTASATWRACSTPPATPTTLLTSATLENTPARSGGAGLAVDGARAGDDFEAGAGFDTAGLGAAVWRAAVTAGVGAGPGLILPLRMSLLMLWASVRMLLSGAFNP